MSQLRVWPFPFTIIVTFGERSQNPGHRFTGAFNSYNCSNLKDLCLRYYFIIRSSSKYLDQRQHSIEYECARRRTEIWDIKLYGCIDCSTLCMCSQGKYLFCPVHNYEFIYQFNDHPNSKTYIYNGISNIIASVTNVRTRHRRLQVSILRSDI